MRSRTCHPTDRVSEVYERCRAVSWQVCFVVNESNVVLGRFQRKAWDADPDTTIEEVMENRPSTFRPDNFLEPLVKRMKEKKVVRVIITDPDEY